MAINKDSNAYTFSFAIIMVVVIGALLAFVATSLKAPQKENVKNEKKQKILISLGFDDISRADAPEKFDKVVTKRVLLGFNDQGVVVEKNAETGDVNELNSQDAFNIDLLKEMKTIKDVKKRNYPLYECEIDGEKLYVIPVMGNGLWAPVWGYISLESDKKTIKGASFDHKSETPGLGAEISKPFFSDQFQGKHFLNTNDEYSPILVAKPGTAGANDVDGISGGTFTSVGVEEMINRTMEIYEDFFIANPNF